MPARFMPGDTVQTTFGKGVVREVRNHGCLLVDVRGRALVVENGGVSRLASRQRRLGPDEAAGVIPAPLSAGEPPRVAPAEVDLHGLTVTEALARSEQALNDAMLTDLPELRLIHGRSGGRVRAALHRRLGEIPSVRSFHVDPRNEGATIVRL
jgi:dsDNA-specific endonuclease/ATPase MutS2